MKTEPFAPLDPALYRETVRRALAEDLGWGDFTTDATIEEGARASGALVAKAPCVIAGLDVAAEAFRQLDPGVTFTALKRDGDAGEAGDRLAELSGFASALLTAERTALNFLQRLSGIATLTRAYVTAADGRITVLDTRKTAPTLRVLEKYAVRAGGGVNHRLTLDEGLLIKENHVRLAGGIAEALRRLHAADHELPIEVEARTLEDVDQALAAGANFIMVDTMSIEDIRETVRRSRGRAKIEIAGAVPIARVPELAATGAEYVSVGALTHSAPAADISFVVESLR